MGMKLVNLSKMLGTVSGNRVRIDYIIIIIVIVTVF